MVLMDLMVLQVHLDLVVQVVLQDLRGHQEPQVQVDHLGRRELPAQVDHLDRRELPAQVDHQVVQD